MITNIELSGMKRHFFLKNRKNEEDKNIQKVEKPQITQVEVNREYQSTFVKNVISKKWSIL
jgi:hypothetical protein